jgi:hypothetical protein
MRRSRGRRKTRRARTTSSTMADSKYGRMFTQSDVEKILEWVEENTNSASAIDTAGILEAMDAESVRFKFDRDEPTFTLRARDKRAAGAIRHYLDHQARNAPTNHIDGIMKAFRSFNTYREENPGQMKEPD